MSRRWFAVAIAFAVIWTLNPIAAFARDNLYVSVKAYSDPENRPSRAKTFATVLLRQTMDDELLEKELLFLVKERLVAQGLRYDSDRPDLLVGVIGYISKDQVYVPPSTFYWPLPTGGSSTTTLSGLVGGKSVYGTATTTASTTAMVPVTRNGYTASEYARTIHVVMARPTTKEGQTTADFVWSGTVDSGGATSDLLIVAPRLLDELLGEFPERSGKPADRKLKWSPPKPKKSKK
jgi:hypothetical protein